MQESWPLDVSQPQAGFYQSSDSSRQVRHLSQLSAARAPASRHTFKFPPKSPYFHFFMKRDFSTSVVMESNEQVLLPGEGSLAGLERASQGAKFKEASDGGVTEGKIPMVGSSKPCTALKIWERVRCIVPLRVMGVLCTAEGCRWGPNSLKLASRKGTTGSVLRGSDCRKIAQGRFKCHFVGVSSLLALWNLPKFQTWEAL